MNCPSCGSTDIFQDETDTKLYWCNKCGAGGNWKINGYHTILIDPPWLERGAGKCKRGADKHYTLMTTDEIERYLIQELIDTRRIDNPCHCYLWVTNNFLEDGLKVLRAIGFEYITNIVWVKDKIGLGQYFRGQHELCLFGVFGKQLTKQRNIPTVVFEKRRKHSEKPRKMYELIEKQSYPPRLELFAREKREGWDAIGLECPTTTQVLFNSC